MPLYARLSDHDFAPMLNMLRNRHYQVVLIEGQRQTKPALRVAADVVFGFEDIMGRSHLLSQVWHGSVRTCLRAQTDPGVWSILFPPVAKATASIKADPAPDHGRSMPPVS